MSKIQNVLNNVGLWAKARAEKAEELFLPGFQAALGTEEHDVIELARKDAVTVLADPSNATDVAKRNAMLNQFEKTLVASGVNLGLHGATLAMHALAEAVDQKTVADAKTASDAVLAGNVPSQPAPAHD